AAADHHWQYRFKQYDLEGLIAAVSKGKIAAGLGAITATAQREQKMDFSHVLISSGLGIAVSGKQGAGWLAIVKALTSGPFISAVIGLLVMLLVVGILVWLFEFRQESQQFSRKPIRGIGAGLWWAAVTATTVGYGDKSPETAGGRIIGMIWMFAALIAVAAFTATITSVLTVGNLSGRVHSAKDLPHVRVASVADTTSGEWLADHNIGYVADSSPAQALKALSAGKVDAVVYDSPLLSYLIDQGTGSAQLRLLPQTLERQDYVIVLPRHSPLRKPLNESILKLLADPQWQAQWSAMRNGGV
ncbi:MAG: transporter substrate-binding domain-containing protein, partial [Sinobacteraceae bacterium]|nr:transporter substrate-binding domain-containing protein [Nevskiaceae bacterium]